MSGVGSGSAVLCYQFLRQKKLFSPLGLFIACLRCLESHPGPAFHLQYSSWPIILHPLDLGLRVISSETFPAHSV